MSAPRKPTLLRLALAGTAITALAGLSVSATGQNVSFIDLPMIGSQWPELVTPAEDAPDILLIMTDDVGYGATSTFGGPVPTPAFDDLAAKGLRYTNMTTVGICSPSRASLLTGRDHNAVNMGNVTDAATGFDGFTSVIPDSAATGARLLRDQGYATAMFGKGHITPMWEMGPNGPFDRWPTGLGFQYFYGFLGGDTNQWAPALIENTLPVELEDEAHLDQVLADRAISWMRRQKAARPDQPFFAYFAPGTAHAPHHAPPEWIARFRGQFDDGWDVMRERTLERQIALGIVPPGTMLAPRPHNIPAWDDLSARQQRVYARQMEVFAAALAYADYQIGRVIEEARARSDGNLLVVYVQGDNGGSAEGDLDGTLNEHGAIAGATDGLDRLEAHMDDMGGPQALGHFSAGWAHATNAPFPWFKQLPSHLGATRNGVVISWAGRFDGEGGLRSQFHHITDIMPTLLEAARIPLPEKVDGVEQQPFDGVSMTYSFASPAEPSRRHSQYYALWDNVGFYRDGWFASTTPRVMPWVFGPQAARGANILENTWQLYDLSSDFSQSQDLAVSHPERLARMIAEFHAAAESAGALPVHRAEGVLGRPDYTAGRSRFSYIGAMDRLSADVGPQLTGRSFDLAATFTLPGEGSGDGAIFATGGRFGGLSIIIDGDRPVFTYNFANQDRVEIVAPEKLAPGNHAIRLELRRQPGWIAPAFAVLFVDGLEAGRAAIPRSNTFRFSLDETVDIGSDTGTPVSERLASPARFGGTIGEVTITLLP